MSAPESQDSPFAFERLRVWRMAREFCVCAIRIADGLPQGRGAARSQLRRSAIAVAQGVAEGAGRRSPRDKANRYTIAKAECDEAMAHILILSSLGCIDAEQTERVRRLGSTVTRMLNGLIDRWSP